MATDNNNGGKAKIKINRKMRTWNKFKKYIIGGGLAILVVVLAIVFTSVLTKKSVKSTNNKETTAVAEATTEIVTETQAQTEAETESETETTAAATTGNSYSVSATATSESYTSSAFYENAAFLGDSVISGISHYGYAASTNVVTDANMTTDKAAGFVDSVAAINPSVVCVMVGLNDFNYGTRSSNDAYQYMLQLVASLKEKLPSASIVVLSVTPISQKYDDANNANQTDIDTYNNLLSEGASSNGYTFVNIADAFKDSTGHLSSDMTNAGYELKPDYYPFLLNKLAECLQ
ncbi:MAG: hypothetical protein II512_01865 [Lachnospira sp.]|nr:hypothetical protein [Lachnospira sp.]